MPASYIAYIHDVSRYENWNNYSGLNLDQLFVFTSTSTDYLLWFHLFIKENKAFPLLTQIWVYTSYADKELSRGVHISIVCIDG